MPPTKRCDIFVYGCSQMYEIIDDQSISLTIAYKYYLMSFAAFTDAL